MFRPRPSCTIVFAPPLNVSPRTPCASLSSVVGCVLDERCRCSVPCRHRRDVLHDAYLWRRRSVLDDWCRRRVPCCRRRDVLHDGSWCCVCRVLDDRCGCSVYCWRWRNILNDASWCCVHSFRKRNVLSNGCSVQTLCATTVAGAMHSVTGALGEVPRTLQAPCCEAPFAGPFSGDQQTSSYTCVVLCLNNYNKFLSRELGR